MSREVDRGIDIGSLKPGFYAVYTVSEDGFHTRLYFEKSIYSDNIVHSVTRNGKRTTVELIANKKLFDAEGAEESVLDQAYLYLKVTSEDVDLANETEYDVAIVTAPALTTEGVSLVGEEYNGYVEAKELWDVAEKLKQNLEAYDLKAYRRYSPYMLSQGQQRRLAVLSVLAGQQQILFLDEPTYGQDQRSTTAIMQQLQHKVLTEGLTVVFVTHDIALARTWADHVYLLQQRQLIPCDPHALEVPYA